MASHREDRADRKLKGVCIECAQPVCPESRTRCARHRLANRERVERHNRKRMAQGICRDCSQPVEPPSHCFCAFHREKHNARSRAYMQRKRAKKAKANRSSLR